MCIRDSGSFGFDFEAIYDEVVDQKKISYTMGDGRQAITVFQNVDGKTKVTRCVSRRTPKNRSEAGIPFSFV